MLQFPKITFQIWGSVCEPTSGYRPQRDEEVLQSIRAETQDRYGRLPASVERLFGYARLRRLAEQIWGALH